jgi:hypothetical protein
MKPLLTKPQIKFLLGLLFYALVLLGISWLPDQYWILGALILLGAITFGFAYSAWLKSTRVITALLILALASTPVKAEAPDVRQSKVAPVLYVCCVVVIGGLLAYATYRVCKALKTIKKNLDNIKTNDVTLAEGLALTNHPNAALHMPAMPESEYLSDDWQQVALTLQSSTDAQNWTDRYAMTNWMGSNLVVSVIYSNSVPLQTNMAPVYWTNDPVLLNFGAVMPTNVSEPKLFWRAVER